MTPPEETNNIAPRGNNIKEDKKMTKKYYSVTYRDWGKNYESTDWYRTKEEAEAFYSSRDYIDPPQQHIARSEATIQKYEELCNNTTESKRSLF